MSPPKRPRRASSQDKLTLPVRHTPLRQLPPATGLRKPTTLIPECFPSRSILKTKQVRLRTTAESSASHRPIAASTAMASVDVLLEAAVRRTPFAPGATKKSIARSPDALDFLLPYQRNSPPCIK